MSSPAPVAFNNFADADSFEELEAVRRVLDSGWLILGEEVRQFEHAWANRCGVDHAIGVGNGLDAIEIGLRGVGIGPGDEVITTPMTAVATVLAIMRAGATPVLADIDPATGLLDPTSVERCIGPRTRAVLLVHLYGQMRGLAGWAAFCHAHGVHLLEDCAQSHDAEVDGRRGGSWGSFGAYSFYPTKNLGAAGDAGALVTNDSELAALAGSLRNYGQANRYEHPLVGLNSRLDEVQAAILRVRLPRLSGWTARRREIAEAYRRHLDNPAVTLLAPPESPESHVHHLFVILTGNRDRLVAHLAEQGVQSLIHYPIPAHHQVPLEGVARDPAGLPAAETHSRTCLSLPCAPHLTDADVDRVVAAVNGFRQ
jgi:dTDP-4-amino-4,6-dideoxygalactose transaminase